MLRDGEAGESLLITHLVVPKQKGGPDSCETLNEQDLFEFQVPHVNIHVLLLAMAVELSILFRVKFESVTRNTPMDSHC